MRRLWKKRYGNRGGGDKYYIDCSHYADNSDSIEIKSLMRYTSDTNVSILEAVAKDETINEKNRHVVVKIGESNSITLKEYQIGEMLKNLNGFIRYICLFSCFDDTGDKIKNTKPRTRRTSIQAVLPKETKICDAEKIDENKKDVLVMPYIQEGSIESYNWTSENIDILKNLMIHVVLSIANAFNNMGFIHQDLHLANVLFKKTTIVETEYKFADRKSGNVITLKEPNRGWRVVIMDFEKAEKEVNDIYYFWEDLHHVLKDISDLGNNKNQKVFWKEDTEILSFIKNARENRMPIRNMMNLIDGIKRSTLTVKSKSPPVTYNPDDVFDFRVK
jgi:serine/threonine protein kinase